jgi:hypothetical protein
MVNQSTVFGIIILDYQVAIIKHNNKSHMNMVIYHFYRMTVVNKHHPYPMVSRRFKSIVTLQGK